MKFATAVIAVATILVAPAMASAETVKNTPGHQMQMKGAKKGSPGASGYTPGHQMQVKGSKKGSPGASGYAPGHQTTGSGSSQSR
jgi:hypothetical protein